jgi:DNA-binding response OmpR family regulator
MGTYVAQGAKAVLVVDDDPEMRALLRDYLRREGFEVVDSATGEHAVALVETRSFDAAIVDKETPGMGGLDLLSFLRHRCPAVPVIVITAFGGDAVAEEAFARGACRYLEKPFRIHNLVAALRSVTAVPGGEAGVA